MTHFLKNLTRFACLMAFLVTANLSWAAPGVVSLQDQILGQADVVLVEQGFEKWEWLRSTCVNCEIVFVAKSPALETAKAQLFLRALSENKEDLTRLYGIHGAEYTLLARMAVGILGRESKFFTSSRYQVKEDFPWAVHFAKVMRSYVTGARVDPNSRGPTQIKVIPLKIVQRYGFTIEDLEVPENAAIATMGFLIEALSELKNRTAIHHLEFITPATYVDYLPYIYFGASKAIVNRTAKPETNAYVQTMKKYMELVDVYERAPRPAL